MARRKDAKSGGSGGEVSPLALQLQQAWVHTQMPNAKKRSASSQLTISCMPPPQQREQQQSALESLSSIFPELAARLPQKKKPMLFSVFQEGEDPKPKEVEVGFNDDALRSSCPFLFPHDRLQSVVSRTQCVTTPPSPLPHRPPLSATTRVVHDSNSLAHLAPAAPADLASHFFSQNSTSLASLRDAYPSPDDKGTAPSQGEAGSSPSNLADLDGVEFFMTEGEANTFHEYLNSFVEEEPESNKCMFLESSAYQAMTQELGDLIAGDDASQFDSETLEKDLYSDDWLNDVLGDPVVADILGGLKNGSRSSFTNDETGDPFLDLDPGNRGLGAPSRTEMHPPEAAAALGAQSSMSQCSFNSESLTACSEDALHHSHIPDGGGNSCHVSKPTSSLWITNGHPILQDDLHHLLFRTTSYTDPETSQLILLWVGPQGSGSYPVATVENLHPCEEQSTISQGWCVVALRESACSSVHGNDPVRCAQVIEANDLSQANKLIAELRQHSSAIGNAEQRMTHYFLEALVARMTGTGGQLYTAVNHNHPSAPEVLMAYLNFFDHCPLLKMSYFFSNMAILKAFGDAKRVHIVDYGILYGMQWPSLIYHLSQLPGGPPHLRITGIDWPKPGFRPTERIKETGHRLARVARQLGVPFDFHAIAEKWEAITPAHLFLRRDEVLAVNCVFRLHHLFDEYVMAASPRNLFLSRIQSMNPKIFVHGVLNGNYNAPFFMSRFQGAMDLYSTLFEAFAALLPAEHPHRVIIEQEFHGRAILNIVACEGLERVERAEPYTSWQARSLRAGFTQMPISESTKAKISALLRHFPRDFAIGEDNGWLLAGWNGKIVYALSAYQPTSRMTSSKQPL